MKEKKKRKKEKRGVGWDVLPERQGGVGRDEDKDVRKASIYVFLDGGLTRGSRYTLVDCEPTESRRDDTAEARRGRGSTSAAAEAVLVLRLQHVFDGSVAWESGLFRLSRRH